MREKTRNVAVYSAGHFLVDLACMFLFARLVTLGSRPLECTLLYNFFAFAGQMPIGLVADKLNRNRLVAVLGCALVAAAYLLGEAPTAACVTAGLGNAMYHVGGGLDTLNRSEGKGALLGVFVSPGAFGLFIGGLLARTAVPTFVPAAALVVMGAAVALLCAPSRNAELEISFGKAGALALLLLALVVALRSYVGFLFSFDWKSGVWAWLFTAGVVLGKALGGFAADRFGSVKTSVVSLALASGLFLLSDSAVLGVAAVLLFNMTMPITLRAAADLLPGAKGFSFGLLTFALFLGFVPKLLGLPGISTPWSYALLSLLSLGLLLPGLRIKP